MAQPADDMPLVCEVCLGGSPFVRMERLAFGAKRCHLSQLPYQAFRWRPMRGRYKETVVSREVAAERNLCQCCLNDLRFGLPAGVRETVLREDGEQRPEQPLSAVGTAYRYSQPAEEGGPWEPLPSPGVALLERLRRVVPGKEETPFRNLPRLCTFWLGGQCRRVAQGRCPFRPCCGTFVFPEVARDRATHERLVASLEREGAAAVQISLDKDVRAALKNSLKGNRGEAIRQRVRGEDELTQRTLERAEHLVATPLLRLC